MVILRMRWIWLLLFLFCLSLSGCILRSIPPDTADFQSAENLKAFEGVFRNIGESSEEEQHVYLSSLIWHSQKLPHNAITTVEVKFVDADSLVVTAFRGDHIEKKDIFVKEQDFTMRHGRIQLSRQWALLNTGGDDPLVGPRYESYEIGLDKKGDAIYLSQGAGAGLIFLIFPVAISTSKEVRFTRIEP